MICPECKEQGLKSKVFYNGGTVTLMYFQPWYDEDGVYHHHDGNTHTNSYNCSNRHSWTTKTKSKCPAGDYP